MKPAVVVEQVKELRALLSDFEDVGFLLRSLRAAMALLVDGEGDRVRRIQMAFSDQDTTPLPSLDRKSAWGAYDSEG